MKIYKTRQGILIDQDQKFYLIVQEWDEFINRNDLYQYAMQIIKSQTALEGAEDILDGELLPPIGTQEVWASGVTYLKSREARMEEAKGAGGGNFYERVYDADRPELFFKASAFRTVGSGQQVRIRKDSKWNVPEPELTLLISSGGKIIGYTSGNDMSSRDIEGENPLYLPQAKTYDQSAAIGPGIFVSDQPIPADTMIRLSILRKGQVAFGGEISISQMKRKHDELVSYLFRECSFPSGCFLMTGTGIVPPDDFTLDHDDEIQIEIDHIGTLINFVK